MGPQEVVTSNGITLNATWAKVIETNMSRDWWWYPTSHVRINELWAIVALEHVLIFLKMCLGACIEDKPSWVVDAAKRDAWENRRRMQMAEDKLEFVKKMQNMDASSLLNSVANFRP